MPLSRWPRMFSFEATTSFLLQRGRIVVIAKVVSLVSCITKYVYTLSFFYRVDFYVSFNQALLSVFKGRMVESRERDTSVERCEVSVQDQPDKTECRLIVKMMCRHGRWLSIF